MLRNRADRRTVAYMVLTTALLPIQWMQPEPVVALVVLACLFGVAAAVIAHNHNHRGIWRSRTLNRITDVWLTIFYGYPPFGWIPTHNQNHHKLNNREGDYTATWRFSEKNNLLTFLTYPSRSGMAQQGPIKEYFLKTWARNRALAWFYVFQFAFLFAFLGVALWLDWQKALLYIVLPQQVSMYSVLIFNYVQHVHANEASATEHSRDFVGWALNSFLFNNGFHTVHHDNPGLHWSEAPAAHRAIEHTLNPRLTETSFWGYVLRTYFLGAVLPRYQSQSMRLERIEDERAAKAPPLAPADAAA